MADAARTGDKQHRRGRDTREKKSIVIGAADHSPISQSTLTGGPREALDNGRIALRRRLLVNDLHPHPHSAALPDCGPRLTHRSENIITPREVDIAHIDIQAHAAGDAVD